MSYAIDVYMGRTNAELTEGHVLMCVMQHGGLCTYRDSEPERIELTVEFEYVENAERAAGSLREMGYHVEGPYDY